jgi:hypothetical protein
MTSFAARGEAAAHHDLLNGEEMRKRGAVEPAGKEEGSIEGREAATATAEAWSRLLRTT